MNGYERLWFVGIWIYINICAELGWEVSAFRIPFGFLSVLATYIRMSVLLWVHMGRGRAAAGGAMVL